MLRKSIPATVIGLALPISGLLLLSRQSAAQSFDFVPIDVPCSACPDGIALSTRALGINPGGDIVGAYIDAVGMTHGFLLSRGHFTTIDVPGSLAGVEGFLPTFPEGISPSGDIVGNYFAPPSMAPQSSQAYCPATGSPACIKGFLYNSGTFSTVLFPGHPGAIPRRITPDGDIYGCYHDFDLMGSMFGFARTRSGYISLAADGGELINHSQSVPASMNNGATPDGQTIVGLWTDMMTGDSHGYVVRNGNFQSYDVPGSTFTYIWDINPAGAFVGVYTSDKNHGFLQLPDRSTPITIDFRELLSAQLLRASMLEERSLVSTPIPAITFMVSWVCHSDSPIALKNVTRVSAGELDKSSRMLFTSCPPRLPCHPEIDIHCWASS
jgi:hypothetical protein